MRSVQVASQIHRTSRQPRLTCTSSCIVLSRTGGKVRIHYWACMARLCTVLQPPPSGPTQFRTKVVKRFIKDDAAETIAKNEQPMSPPQCNTLFENTLVENDSLTRALTMTIQSKGKDEPHAEELLELVAFTAKMIPRSKDHTKYADSRKKEIDGLINRSIFIPVSIKDARGYRMYGSRFVEYVNHEGTPNAFEKSCFVAMAFNDEIEFMTHAPTVLRASQRMLNSNSASDGKLKAKSHDINQAFTQAKMKLQRPVFIRPSQVLGYPPDFLFRAMLPIYWLSESRLHWFHTYSGFHTENCS